MFYHLALGALVAAATVEASLENNLVYRSPSRRHPTLAVPLSHVWKRQTGEFFTPAEVDFTHGVASGDPYADSVILWTRLAPSKDSVASDLVPDGVVPIYNGTEGLAPSSKAACVEFKIATDLPMTNVVDQGRAYTTSDVDYTVKVRDLGYLIQVSMSANLAQFEANGLKSFTTYYYQFNVCDSEKKSPLGRTKTTPTKNQKVDRSIKLAVYSCANYRESQKFPPTEQPLMNISRGLLQRLRQPGPQRVGRLRPAPRRLHLRV